MPADFNTFDPTPALEHDPRNFSPLNGERKMPPYTGFTQSKEVHFSDAPVPIVARHSIATENVPLLPSIPSASQIPKQSFLSKQPPPGIDMTAYMEHCRYVNEQLRTAQESERKAWTIERSALLARIADLEFQLNKSRDTKRRSSNDSSATSAHTFKTDFSSAYSMKQPSGPRSVSLPVHHPPSGPPVWRGPETTPPVTRVFSHDDSDVSHLPSILEDAEPFPDLSREISPSTRSKRKESRSIDVSQVDRSLDGITLRSTGPGVTSSFSAKITSPQFSSPPRTPSPKAKSRPPSNTLTGSANKYTLGPAKLLDPLDRKLKLHAGHTPMAIDGAMSVSENVTELPTPGDEGPVDPAPTKRPPLRPSEDSDSYFSYSENMPRLRKSGTEDAIEEEPPEDEPNFDPEDDPSLTGPLMLDPSAKSQAANSFLDQVDAKLSEVAAHSRLRSDTTTTDGTDIGTSEAQANAQTQPPQPLQSKANGAGKDDNIVDDIGDEFGHIKNKDSLEDMPKLRIKKSMNFGSAWGGHIPGRNF